MTEYSIEPSTRRCRITGRELRPGEKVYSVLLDQEGKFVRHDYAVEAWSGPPAEAYGFWLGQVPSPDAPRRPPINDELLSDCFNQLEGETAPGKISVRYVLGLLLMRRRRLRLEETLIEEGCEILVMRCVRSGEKRRVINPGLTDQELAAVQDEVFKALGWD
jgi:hypothetical protein